MSVSVLYLALCIVAVASQDFTTNLKPEFIRSKYCENQDSLFIDFNINAKSFKGTAPPGQVISCIQCLGGENGTFDITSGGLNQTEVAVKLYEPCSLKVWSTTPPTPAPPKEGCSGKGREVYDSVLNPGSTVENTYSDRISCWECKDKQGNLKSVQILSGGVGYHSIKVSFYEECRYKLYVNEASFKKMSSLCLLFSVYFLLKF